MLSIIDMDTFLPIYWSEKLGNRVFQFDAFISHNRRDKYSKFLAKELETRGAIVWHDNDQDVRDKRVEIEVNNGLLRSRFVIISIDETFKNSPWCRAEYLPALESENESSVPRVLIAKMVPNIKIPADLIHSPLYNCYEKSGLDKLSNEIQRGNQVPFALDEINTGPVAFPTFDDVRKLFLDLDLEEDSEENLNSIILYSVINVANRLELGHNVGTRLMECRSAFIRNTDLTSFSESELHYLVSATLFFCSSADSDVRANGLYMLQHLAEYESTNHLFDKAFDIFHIEKDEGILNDLGFPWFDQFWKSLNGNQRAIAELCALRSFFRLQLYYADSQMVRDFSAITRVRIFAKGINTENLSYSEKMFLIEERANYILNVAKPITGDYGVDRLRGVLGITDVELLFREINALLFIYPSNLSREHAATVSSRVVKLIDRITNYSSLHNGMPLILIEDWLLDDVLNTLLWCISLKSIREDACIAYGAVCDVIENYGVKNYLVPIYRDFMEVAVKEPEINDGIWSNQFENLRAKLFEEESEHQRLRTIQEMFGENSDNVMYNEQKNLPSDEES